MKLSFQALGTTWWIEIWDDITHKSREEVTDFLTAFVTKFENNYSRFKSDSLVSILNRERTIANPSPDFVTLLEYGKQLYLRSETHFNFLTGHILEARGYDADYSFIQKDTPINWSMGNPVTDLAITNDSISLQGHANIDLGGYGKGYLIDLLVEQLKQKFHLEQFLINGGGDLFATNKDGEAITIHLEHPTQAGTMIGTTTIYNQAFAASSPHKRHWPAKDGSEQTHIIADNITFDATFIKTACAADADAFATAAIQLNQNQLETLAKAEQLAIALFDIKTGRLVASKGF